MKLSAGRLAITFVVAVAVWLAVQEYGQTRVPHPLQKKMRAAARLTGDAFAVIDSVKRTGGLMYPRDSSLPWASLLGEDYTALTTTLGSRAAKEVSTNPMWASVMVRLLSETGVSEGDTVVVMISASFPALAVSTLAALQKLGATSLVVASLGASSYGANLREGTWLDWQTWLRNACVLDVRPALVTAGGEQDAAIGLSAEGGSWMDEAAQRNGADLKRYSSLADAIAARMTLFSRHRIAAVVNIGGGHASMGACRHAASLPVGPWDAAPVCSCPDRGVLTRIAQQGIPVIHLLQIRHLAALYGIDFEPGSRYINKEGITTVLHVRVAWIMAALTAIVASLVISGKRLLP